MPRPLDSGRVMLAAALLWIGLMVTACAEGGENDGKVTRSVIEAGAPGLVTFGAGTELGKKAALEVRVKPIAVKSGADALLRIDLVETDSLKAQGGDAEKFASSTVAFFPPARPGDERAFVVPLNRSGRSAAKATALTAVVSLVPSNPDRTLDGIRMEVTGARLR